MVTNGRASKVDHVDLGEPLLHDVDSWHERRRAVTGRHYIEIWVIELVVFPVWMALELAFSGGFAPLWWVTPLTLYLSYCLISMAWEELASAADLRNGTVTALFEGGVHVRYFCHGRRFLIPYQEIEGFTVSRSMGGSSMVFRLKLTDKLLAFDHLDAILGEEGLALLRDRVGQVDRTPAPPRLRLYGPRREVEEMTFDGGAPVLKL